MRLPGQGIPASIQGARQLVPSAQSPESSVGQLPSSQKQRLQRVQLG